MIAIVVGPSRIRSGVAATVASWLHGFGEIATDVRFITNRMPPRAHVPLEPRIAHVKSFQVYDLPTSDMPIWNGLEIERAFRSVGSGDVLFIDYTSDLIPPSVADGLLRCAKGHGMRTAVRIHSQRLQHLPVGLVDLFVGPCSLSELAAFDDGASGGHAREIQPARYVELPHPISHRPPAGSWDSELVIGLGRADRMPHESVRETIEALGFKYEAWDGTDAWRPMSEVLRDLRRAAALVLWYAPIRGVGRSSMLGTAVATGGPVIVSDSNFLADAHVWADERHDLRKAVLDVMQNPTASDFQLAYEIRCAPERLVVDLLNRLG